MWQRGWSMLLSLHPNSSFLSSSSFLFKPWSVYLYPKTLSMSISFVSLFSSGGNTKAYVPMFYLYLHFPTYFTLGILTFNNWLLQVRCETTFLLFWHNRNLVPQLEQTNRCKASPRIKVSWQTFKRTLVWISGLSLKLESFAHVHLTKKNYSSHNIKKLVSLNNLL